jgi:hypothetical protein
MIPYETSLKGRGAAEKSMKRPQAIIVFPT